MTKWSRQAVEVGILKVHSYLVHPAKAQSSQPTIGGTRVPHSGRLFDMLKGIYDKAPQECEIEIVFRRDALGQQKNARLDDLVRYTRDPTLAHGREIAKALQAVTTNRSRLGLLFLMVGDEQSAKRLVVSRFAADQGVIAEEQENTLTVEFLERVFMKSAKAYKSALYESKAPAKGYWSGRAVDRQISGGPREVSEYWIHEFLMSELRTTGPAGTRRLALALREAIRSSAELETRQELIAAATLAAGLDGEVVTGTSIVESLHLSDRAAEALRNAIPAPELLGDSFAFDKEEFDKHLQFRILELSNGAILTAESEDFDEVFQREELDGQDGIERFTTEGSVKDERLRSYK